jgi:hypothetical protein
MTSFFPFEMIPSIPSYFLEKWKFSIQNIPKFGYLPLPRAYSLMQKGRLAVTAAFGQS